MFSLALKVSISFPHFEISKKRERSRFIGYPKEGPNHGIIRP